MKIRLERALRTIAALPDDDWQPADWSAFESARAVIVDEVRFMDRHTPTQRVKSKREPLELQQARTIVHKRSGGYCEANTPACAAGDHQAEHVHHKQGRRRNAPGDLLHVCLAAHSYIHANPAESYQHGWMVKRLGAA